MFCVKTEDEVIKTFNVEILYDFLVKVKSKPLKFYINYLEVSKGDFLKSYLQISGSWSRYFELEKLFIDDNSKSLWRKIIKPSKK